ncbi:MAG: DUF1848 domain-containing protein [Treponema sp.]|nr:DUF1848 domain-containing protein [Treponema sp.]
METFGIGRNKCIDNELIERLFNVKVPAKKDPSQRPECGCCASRDIGSYNTCRHDCVYCYARRGPERETYCPTSPMLCDALRGGEKIYDLPVKPVKQKSALLPCPYGGTVSRGR